jgi:hypothetical protein
LLTYKPGSLPQFDHYLSFLPIPTRPTAITLILEQSSHHPESLISNLIVNQPWTHPTRQTQHALFAANLPALSVPVAKTAEMLQAITSHLLDTAAQCQESHWDSHKSSCRAAQPSIKLFRTGQLLQECFLAARAEAFDLCITRVERAQDGTIHFFDTPAERVRPISPALTNDVVVKNAVLSWGAGRDLFAGSMFELTKQALKGTSKSLMIGRKRNDHADLVY